MTDLERVARPYVRIDARLWPDGRVELFTLSVPGVKHRVRRRKDMAGALFRAERKFRARIDAILSAPQP